MTATTEMSKGHLAFVGKLEFYVGADGDVYRAQIAAPVVSTGRRFGRWESRISWWAQHAEHLYGVKA